LALDQRSDPELAADVDAFLTRIPSVPLANAPYWWHRYGG
jgi:hypothetical protein